MGEEVANPVVQNAMDVDNSTNSRNSGFGMAGPGVNVGGVQGLIDDEDDMYSMLNDSLAR